MPCSNELYQVSLNHFISLGFAASDFWSFPDFCNSALRRVPNGISDSAYSTWISSSRVSRTDDLSAVDMVIMIIFRKFNNLPALWWREGKWVWKEQHRNSFISSIYIILFITRMNSQGIFFLIIKVHRHWVDFTLL